MCRLIDQILSDLVRFGLFLGIDIGYDRDGGVMDVDLVKDFLQSKSCRFHQSGMEWRADLQHDGTASACFLQCFTGFLNSCCSTRDDDLSRAVEIHCLNRKVFGGDFAADLHDGFRSGTDDSCHAAFSERHRFLHEAATQMDGMHGICEGDRTRCDQRRVFAKAVACCDIRREAVFLQHLPYSDTGRQNGRLGEFGLHQLCVRAFEHHFGNREAERFIRFFDQGFDRIIVFKQILYHAHLLRSLSREQKCSFHVVTLRLYDKYFC